MSPSADDGIASPATPAAAETEVQVSATLKMSPADYVDTRLAQYQHWYDQKAITMKARHLRFRTVAVAGGALVPVLVNLPVQYISIATTVISLLVVILVSLESVYHYREQWKNYRSTEQVLGHERVYYSTRTGVYQDLGDEDAFRLLVERVESAIAAENASTLSTMTLAGQVAGESANPVGTTN